MNLPARFSARPLIYSIVFAAWALAALLFRDAAPWVFWATMAVLPAVALVGCERTYLKSPAGRAVIILSAVVFLAHVVWAICRASFYDAASPATYWIDDHNYFNESAALAQAWRSGEYPEFWLKGSPPYIGTLHTGYHRPLATLFFLFGPATIWGLLLNALCAAAMPLLAALCSRYLWENDLTATNNPRQDFGSLAALLVALHPMQFYWSAFLMKDTFVAFVFMAGLTLIMGVVRHRNPSLGIGAAMVVPYMFTVRAYTAMSLFLGSMTLPLLGIRRKTLFGVTAIGFGLIYLLCAYTSTGNALYRQLRDSFLALAPRGVESPTQLLLQMITGIPRFFLAPYAWLLLPQPTPMYGMYPGMWYLYLVGYPLGFSGFYWALRRNIRLAAVPIMVFALSALVFLSAVYQGEASRQRFYLEYVMLLFAAYGIRNFSRAWSVSILGLEAAFAIGQVLALQ